MLDRTLSHCIWPLHHVHRRQSHRTGLIDQSNHYYQSIEIWLVGHWAVYTYIRLQSYSVKDSVQDGLID